MYFIPLIYNQLYPLVNCYITNWKITMLFSWENSRNQWAMFNSKLLVITRGYRMVEKLRDVYGCRKKRVIIHHGKLVLHKGNKRQEGALDWDQLRTLHVGLDQCCESHFMEKYGKKHENLYNVNPGLINHGLLIRGYSSNSHNTILKWYPAN